MKRIMAVILSLLLLTAVSASLAEKPLHKTATAEAAAAGFSAIGSPAAKATKVESIKLNKTSATLDVGKTVQLKATVSPASASNKKVKWSSSNKKVASVSASGKVKALKAGQATITCQAADGSGVSAACVVDVRGALDYKKYYKEKLKPEMDSIANCVTRQFSSLEDLKNAFYKANEAYLNLEKATNALDVLKKDAKVKKFLKALKKNIQEGGKRAESAPESDEKIQTYLQNTAKNLKLYMERVQTLLKIN